MRTSPGGARLRSDSGGRVRATAYDDTVELRAGRADALVFVTCGRRLHAAARAEGLSVLPETLP